MYMVKYQCGMEIQTTRQGSRVVNQHGVIVFEGADIECVKWLAERADKRAQEELRARVDA